MSEQEQINELRKQIEELKQVIDKNNFSTYRYFDQNIRAKRNLEVIKNITLNGVLNLNGVLKMTPQSLPSSGDVGDLCVNGSTLYILTSLDPTVWTIVGTQS